jgi:hypothetical protein
VYPGVTEERMCSRLRAGWDWNSMLIFFAGILLNERINPGRTYGRKDFENHFGFRGNLDIKSIPYSVYYGAFGAL